MSSFQESTTNHPHDHLHHHDHQNLTSENICIIGGGNWGSAIAKKIGQNLQITSPNERIIMWLYEEFIHHRPLTEIINETHENVKYLPSILLPSNIMATSNLQEAVKNKKFLFFVIPHQFLRSILIQLKEMNIIHSDTICISLMKGIEANHHTHSIKRFTTMIEEELNIHDCVALMGANVATDVAHDHFAEATIACKDVNNARQVAELLESDYFRTEITTDVSTVEWCGALKNVYAIAAGISDGMNLGPNAKAALIRQGLKEMMDFCRDFDQTGNFRVSLSHFLSPFLTCSL